MEAGLAADIVREDWKNAAIAAGNLSEQSLTLGKVAEAVAYAEQALELASRIEDLFERQTNLVILADALHQAGRLLESESAFQQAEEIQEQRQPQYPLLHAGADTRYCDLLLGRVESLTWPASLPDQVEQFQQACRAVQNRADQTLEWAKQSGLSLLTVALGHLTLGRVHLLTTQLEGTSDFNQATEYLNRAVNGLREAGQQSFVPRGLLARAALRRVQKQYREAWADVEEAMEIVERGSMRLLQADGLLESVRLHWEEGDAEQARTCLDRAKKMIDAMGYHRRDREVEALERVLSEGAEAET